MTNNSPSPPESSVAAVVLHHAVTALMIMLMLAIAVWAFLTFRDASFFQSPDRASQSIITERVARAQLQRVASALEVHQRLHDRYPNTLQELVDAGLLLPSDLYHPHRGPYIEYRRSEDRYTLSLTPPPS